MDSPLITIEQCDSYLIIRLNRPEKSNALTQEMILALSHIFTKLDTEPNIRAVILTGTGNEAFCAGTDVPELAGPNESELFARGQDLFHQIDSCRVPVIAAVNGIAAGEGCELALACHLRIASANARFSLPEARSGIVRGYESTLELLTGKEVPAKEALRSGLVNHVVPAARLLAQAEALAREIAQLAPLAIRACLEAVNQGIQLPLAEALALETKLFASLFDTDDVREGTSAFLEKRSPVFKGT